MILLNLFRTSVGRKIIVAITGIGLGLFLLIHMAGNLQVYLGPNAINGYAASLHSHPGLVWVTRTGLLGFFLLHALLVTILTLRNSAARPESYKHGNTIQASIASRTMIYSGLVILAFLVYHLLHFTAGVVQNEFFHVTDTQGRHDVYNMVIMGFRQLPVLVVYAAALVALAIHLYHGLSSVFQSLGIVRKDSYSLLKVSGAVAMVIIITGFLAVPAGIALEIIKI